MRQTPEAIRAQAEHLRDALAPHHGVEVEEGVDMPVARVPREKLRPVMEQLAAGPAGYRYCAFVTAIDHIGREPRFDVLYGIFSYANNRWLRVVTTCGELDASVPTVTDLWPGANYMERECWDLFGIRFEGHPDLRRLLMPEAYEYHPLRKEFPRDGIQPDRLYREWFASRRQPQPEEAP